MTGAEGMYLFESTTRAMDTRRRWVSSNSHILGECTLATVQGPSMGGPRRAENCWGADDSA